MVICLKLRVKLHFYGFESVFCILSHKTVQTCFVWYETCHTLLFGVYFCAENVRIEKISLMLVITV